MTDSPHEPKEQDIPGRAHSMSNGAEWKGHFES